MKRIFAWLLCLAMLVSLMAMPAMAAEQPTVFRIDGTGIVAEDGATITTQTPFGRGGTTARYAPSVPKFVPAMQSNAGQEEGFSTQSAQISRASVYVSTSGTLPSTLTDGNAYIIDADYTHKGNLTVNGTVTIRLGKYNGAGVTFTLNGMIKLTAGARLNITVEAGTTSPSYIVRHTAHVDQLVYVTGGSKLYVYGGTSSSNKIIFDGKGNAALDPLIYVSSDPANAVYMENCVVRNATNRSKHNDSTGDEATRGLPGGGIYMSGGTLYLGYGVSLTNNIARMGAGLYLTGESVVKSWTGESGDPAASKPKIYNNSADIGDGYGGGIFLGGNAVYSAYLGSLENNKAIVGGGLYLGSNAVWNPKDVVYIRKNTASQYGGGIYMGGSAVYSAALSYIETNNAGSGGGLYLTGNATWNSKETVYIRGNNADKYGGGIYMKGGTMNIASGHTLYVGASGNGNKAAYGGGFYAANGTIKGAGMLAIRYNTATSNGGGLMVESGTLTIGGTQNVQIAYNTATNGYGGGIVVYGSNSALNDTSTGTFNVSGNTAKTYGGGIYVNTGKITTNGMTVGSSSETDMNHADWGGGICIWSGSLNINGPVNVQYNKATIKGGGVYVYSGTISCAGAEQLNIYNNTANYGGGMYLGGSTNATTDTEKKTITFNGSGSGGIDVYKNTGNTNGGGIMAENCDWNCAIPLYVSSNITSGYGGGLYLNSWINPVTMTATSKISVCNNTATGIGGGIYLKDGTLVNSGTLMVNTNSASTNGGGIYLNAGTLNNNSTLTVNTNSASTNGGGIYLNGGTLNNNSTLTVNTNSASTNGGGIYLNSGSLSIQSGATLNIGASDKANTATNGGGLYLNGGTFTNNGTLNVNTNTATNSGGGIYMGDASTFAGTGTVILYQNSAMNGAGLFMSGSTVKFAPTGTVQIYGNVASGKGGGIYSSTTWTLSSNIKIGCTVGGVNIGNTATYGGGIYIVSGTVTTTGTVDIRYNTATEGGGICLSYADMYNNGTLKVYNNTATKGGGMYIFGEKKFTNAGSLYIQSNQGTDGGGIFLSNATLEMTGEAVGYIQGNRGKDTDVNQASLQGAGIYVQEGTITLNSSRNLTIYENVGRYGPGIYFGSTGKLITINGDGTGYLLVYENHDRTNAEGTTGSDGASIWIESCMVNVAHKVLINRQVYASTVENDGDSKGAIRIQRNGTNANGILNILDGGSLIIERCSGGDWAGGITMNEYGELRVKSGGILEINGCSSIGNGGAIQNKGGIITNEGTMTIGKNSENTALNGGGIYLNGGKFISKGTLTIQRSRADGNGGGLYMTNSTVELIGTTSIFDNRAASNGGGVYISNSTLRNEGMLHLSYNTASTNGGGLLINDGNVYLNKTCVIEMNTARNGAGICQTNGKTIVTDTIELRRNNAHYSGAGIYMNNGTLDVSGNVILVENKAMADGGGLFVYNGTVKLNSQSNFDLNTAASGGGLYIAGGMVDLYGATNLRSNVVNGKGGGLYIAGNGTICANDAPLIIEGNKAENGGGVYTNGGTTIFSASTTITGNTAMKNGGGIYIAGSGTLTMLNFKKSPIRENVASVAGNDIYAVGDTTTVNISATMDGAEEEYWFADYADGDANYPGQPVFASAENAGRYNADSTIEHARRSFGAAFEEAEPGAKVAANACLALTLGINLHKVCAHTNTKEVVVTAATCTEPGEASILCADCGEALGTKSIPALGHTEVADSAVAPTCVSAGLTEGSHCAVCKVVIVAQTTIPALDHTYEGVITTEPTCYAAGVMTYTCSACDHVYTEEIPQLVHNYECEETSAPTCEAAGVKIYTCTHCGNSYTEAVTATGHTAEIDPAVAATCTTDGLTEGSHCSVCKAVIVAQEVIPAFGHSHEQTETVAPTCTEDGVTTYACANCGDAYTKPIPAKGHSFVDGVCTVCGAVEPEPDAVLDPTIKVYHSLNLASDISVNFAVPKSYMADYNMDTVYMECTMDLYEGNKIVGTKTYKLLPTEVGSYYYFVMSHLTAMQMNDRMIAVLYGVKNGQKVYSAPDNYSVADYAYTALNNEAMGLTLKNLCADLLRYGAIAQSYKGYRTDALADSGITKEQEIHLSDLSAVTFGSVNEILKNLENPSVAWVGKTLSMESKVSIKYVFDLSNFRGNRDNLNLRVSYIDAMGGRKDVILTDMEAYYVANNWYSFSYSGLLVAELRTVLSAQVYDGDTPVSETLLYSPDTYGNGQTGLLDLLCRAIFAYSDSAKAFFVN